MDSDEVVPESPSEIEEAERRRNRQFARIYRMYAAYRRDGDSDVMSFPEYASLFHDVSAAVAARWLATIDTYRHG